MNPELTAVNPALTHAAVMDQYIQDPNANADMLDHMARLRNAEDQAAAAAQTEAVHIEAERPAHNITPKHHDEHEALTELVAPKALHESAGVIDNIGEMAELGITALGETEVRAERPLSALESAATDLATYRQEFAALKANPNTSPQDMRQGRERFYGQLASISCLGQSGVRESINLGNCKDQELDALVGELAAAMELRGHDDFKTHDTDEFYFIDPRYVISDMPTSYLQKNYFPKAGEESPMAKTLRLNQEQDGKTDASMMMDMLADVYQVRPGRLHTMVDQYGAGPDPNIVEIINEPVYKLQRVRDMREAPKPTESKAELDLEVEGETVELLKDLLVDPKVYNEYRRVIDERTMLKDEQGKTLVGEQAGLDVPQLKQVLTTLCKVVRDIGPNGCKQLYEQSGIINFDNYATKKGRYNSEQLRRMQAYNVGDKETINHLSKGDLTVVFTDARGDHNGAMGNNSNLFGQEEGRTLFFEINQPSDVYRFMIGLKQKGLKPATMVMAAHGSAGNMWFGSPDEAGSFRLSNDKAAGDSLTKRAEGHSIYDSKGLPRLVEEYMQPSRGIDAPAESIGRRRIILASCSQAVKKYVRASAEQGNYTMVEESTADTVTRVAANETLDVYASPEPVIYKKTADGIATEAPVKRIDGTYLTNPDGTFFVQQSPIRRHQVDKNNRVVTEDQATLKLKEAA